MLSNSICGKQTSFFVNRICLIAKMVGRTLLAPAKKNYAIYFNLYFDLLFCGWCIVCMLRTHLCMNVGSQGPQCIWRTENHLRVYSHLTLKQSFLLLLSGAKLTSSLPGPIGVLGWQTTLHGAQLCLWNLDSALQCLCGKHFRSPSHLLSPRLYHKTFIWMKACTAI